MRVWECTVARNQPWRKITPTANIVSTAGPLLFITAGVLLPSLRRVSLPAPGRSTTVVLPGGRPVLLSGGLRKSRWAKRESVRHRVRTGKPTPLPAQVPGGEPDGLCAHLVVLETNRKEADTCGEGRFGSRASQTKRLNDLDWGAPPPKVWGEV